MPKFANLKGLRFGMLTVTKMSLVKTYRIHWICKCDCGNSKTIASNSLLHGKSNSCGCQMGLTSTHEHARRGRKTPEYYAWINMKQRCYNPNRRQYQDYGGRGITVCKRWLDSYENFFADMGPRPSSKHSLDRKNNDRGYSKSNCRWATSSEQAYNRRPKSR